MKKVTLTFKHLLVAAVATILISCDPNDEVPISPPSIDLKAEFILFSVEPISQFTGTATITGNIINIGEDFRSGDGQQQLLLYERQLGVPTSQPGDIVARLPFTNLVAGGRLEISYSRPWNSSSPAEGEFPPEYILVISYDPDLYIDGNLYNDDTNQENDEILVSGSLINGMF